MFRRIVYILTILLLMVSSATRAGEWWNTDYNTTEGTDFWVTFMRNSGKGKFQNDLFLRLYASARQDADVDVTFNLDTTALSWTLRDSVISFHVASNDANGLDNQHAIPNIFAYVEDSTDRYKGVYIHSSTPISLYALNYFKGSYDATQVLPMNALGKSYVIQTYRQDHSATEFVLVATRNFTEVHIQPVENDDKMTERVVHMNMGDTYLYRANNSNISLAGTQICSSEPIAVFQGGQDAYVPVGSGNGPANHLLEQTPPTDLWGKKFIVSRTAQQAVDVLRITAATNNTDIYINGSKQKTINASESYELNIQWSKYPDGAICVETSHATYCGLYLTSKSVKGNTTGVGAPTYTSLVPLELGVHSTIISSFEFDEEYDQYQYINVVMPSSSISGFRLDGKAINASRFRSLSHAINGVQYSFACLENLDAGAHVLSNDQATFVSHVYGIASYFNEEEFESYDESYAYSGGSRINHSADILINDKYKVRDSICINEDPVKFSAVINYDYDSLRWIHHSLYGDDVLQGRHDSLLYRDFHEAGTDTIKLIISSHTPICDFVYRDTICVALTVLDTAHTEHIWENGETIRTLCYGEEFEVQYREADGQHKKYHLYADEREQNYPGGKIKFKLNQEYCVIDSFETSFSCDSTVWQRFIIRPVYEKLVRDTICFNELPYEWHHPLREPQIRRELTGYDYYGNPMYNYVTVTDTVILVDFSDLKRKENIRTKNKKDTLLREHNPLTIYGCDSVLRLELHIYPEFEKDIYVSICANEDYTFEEAKNEKDHKYHFVGPGYDGYDPKKDVLVAMGDWQDSVVVCDTVTYSTSQMHVCDSIYRLHLTVRNIKITWLDDIHLCQGDDVPKTTLNGRVVSFRKDLHLSSNYVIDSIYSQMSVSASGCDSVTRLRFRVDSVYHYYDTLRICQNPLDTIYFWDNSEHKSKTKNPKHIYSFSRLQTVDKMSIISPLATIHGCDSIFELLLTVDTVYNYISLDTTICDDGWFEWEGRTYAGQKAPKDKREAATADRVKGYGDYTEHIRFESAFGCDSVIQLRYHVDTTTTTYIREHFCTEPDGQYVFQAKNMKYRLDVAKTIYDTAYLSTTRGCDSIVYLQLEISQTYNFDTIIHVCEEPQGVYNWEKHSGKASLYNVDLDRPQPTISINSVGTYHFEDRNKSKQSHELCDSIYHLTLIVHPVYHQDTVATICEGDSVLWDGKWYCQTGEYTNEYKTHSPALCDSIRTLKLTVLPKKYTYLSDQFGTSHAPFDWNGHHIEFGRVYDTTLVATLPYGELGCDSIVSYHITVHQSYETVLYDTTCLMSPFVWTLDANDPKHVHNLKVDSVGDYIYRDTLLTYQGSDSAFVLYFRVNPVYATVDTITMSDEETRIWEHRIYVGSKVNADTIASSLPRVYVPNGKIINDYDTIYPTIHGCDSTRSLHLLVGPTYRDTIVRYTCDNEPYHWFPKGGSREARTDLVLLEPKLYYDSLKTIGFGFDSIHVLDLRNYPTYSYEKSDTVCQGETYHWYGHDTVHISTSHVGTFTYTDHLKTAVYGCDSVWTLHLFVPESYYYYDTLTICQTDTIHWQDSIIAGDLHYDDITNYPVRSVDPAGVHDYVVGYESQYGCDSIYNLHLTINPAYVQVIDTTYEHICDNETYHFQTVDVDTIYNTISDWVTGDYRVGRHILTGRDTTIHGCDSVVCHVVYVHPTYTFSHDTAVCQGDAYLWLGHDTVHVSTAQVGTFTYTDHLKTAVYDCDSIWTLTIRVDSVYAHTDTITMSDEETRIWEQRIYVGSKVNADTIASSLPRVYVPNGKIINDYDTVYPTIHGCDSTRSLHLLVGPTYRDTIVRYTCENEPYHWFPKGGSREARTDLVLLEPKLYYDSLKTIGFGFDSIYVLDLRNNPIYSFSFNDTICQGDYYEWPKETPSSQVYFVEENRWVSIARISTANAGTYTYRDSLKTTSYLLGDGQESIVGCDSVWTLHLFIPDTFHIYEQATICENDTLEWQGHLFVGREYAAYGRTYDPTLFREVSANLSVGVYAEIDTAHYYTIYGCDSIYHLQLLVTPVYRVDSTIRVCQNDMGYTYSLLNNGQGGILPTQYLHQSLVRNDTVLTMAGCDSIVTLHYFVDSVYRYVQDTVVCQSRGETWIWYNEFGDPQDTISIDRGDTTFTLGTIYHTIHGCDSVFGMQVYVAPSYYFFDTLDVCQNCALEWQDSLLVGDRYEGDDGTMPIRATLAPGAYDYSINYGTHISRYPTHSCDSIYYLHLIVHPIYEVDDVLSVCENEQNWTYDWQQTDGLGNHYSHVLSLDRIRALDVAGTIKHDTLYTLTDTIRTIHDCDSIVTLQLTVHPMYEFMQDIHVCQDTILRKWEWVDEQDGAHDSLDISQPGVFTYVDKQTTQYGCDSVFGIRLTVDPIYRFDSIYTICENERITWQGKQYTGDSCSLEFNDSIILKPGVYTDTAYYTTIEGCDSTHYLQLYVYAIYDTTTYVDVCAEDGFTWIQHDIDGSYADVILSAGNYDTIAIYPYQALAAQSSKAIDTLYHDRMLQTIHHCDSMSRLVCAVHPSYFFFSDTTICANNFLQYRGIWFGYKDTVYTEHLYTTYGCDSIYQLHLHVRPIFIEHLYEAICDNETLWHTSDNGQEPVWRPGQRVPHPDYEWVDMVYTDHNGCDSIYRYHLTIHPTFFSEIYDTICSGTDYIWRPDRHIMMDEVYDQTTANVAPREVTYRDSLSTIHGCDSVYHLHAYIFPSYLHVDYDTICANGATSWRGHTYENLKTGNYVYRDEYTTIHGCDSIYELRLVVHPVYLQVETATICADEYYRFHGTRDVNQPGFHYDSLLSVHGCDSVFHLYLTVLDTTMEVIYDTICYGDTLVIHGAGYYAAGDYKDTTLNAWDCHHFTYIHLHLVPPTVPTAWVDTLCKEDYAFDVAFTYTGPKPLTYSLYFDDFGHEQGFSDLVDEPVIANNWMDSTYYFTVRYDSPDGEENLYPRPDHYPFTLYLDNGYCLHKEFCVTDTTFVMNYPSWLTEQRFRDIIAILSEKYNGGYTFSSYQWYRNNRPLPGETHPYLYIPQELEVSDTVSYHVRLVREGETESFQTCPIWIRPDYIDHPAPCDDYMSVVPTYVTSANPCVDILNTTAGTFYVYTAAGKQVYKGQFDPGHANAYHVCFPDMGIYTQGMYIFRLEAPNANCEKERSVKIIYGGE